MINVAIMGHGTVGSGVAEILINNNKHIAEKSNNEILVKYILDIRDFAVLQALLNKFISRGQTTHNFSYNFNTFVV